MKVILDTNIALNVWLFKDAATTHTLAHLFDVKLYANTPIYGTPAMLKELLRVATSPHLSKYATNTLTELEALWREHVCCIEPNQVRSPLRCRDADDQMFLDLASQIDAQIIYTLDRDLLKLKKRAALMKLLISPP